MGLDYKYFVVYTNKGDENVFIVYRLYEETDNDGYNIYDAISIIKHD